MSKKSDFGLIGLAVMGQNLVLNVESRGFQVSVYNRTTSVTDEFLAKHPDKQFVGAHTLEAFVESLATPRKIHIMVKSTAVKDSDRDAVDAVIEQLIPLLDKDDIVIDGGMLTWLRRGCVSLERVFRAGKRGRARGHRSCLAGLRAPGR
jgi:6-phosphogluconate dehydrogenase